MVESQLASLQDCSEVLAPTQKPARDDVAHQFGRTIEFVKKLTSAKGYAADRAEVTWRFNFQILRLMRVEGFPRFQQHNPTALWQELDTKNPGNGFGKQSNNPNTWIWCDSWVARVRARRQEHAE